MQHSVGLTVAFGWCALSLVHEAIMGTKPDRAVKIGAHELISGGDRASDYVHVTCRKSSTHLGMSCKHPIFQVKPIDRATHTLKL